MRSIVLPLLLAAALAPSAALGDSVVVSEKVQSHLVVRKSAAGPALSTLRPGERATLVATRAGWHEVALADGRTGFVSAAWTRVERDAASHAAAESAEGPVVAHVRTESRGLGGALRGIAERAGRWLGRTPEIELVLRDPVRDGAIHEHDDPLLPVAGIALPEGGAGAYDLVIALDASASTYGFAQADVDGDGRLDPRWKGPDSIYQAQIRAARALVAELARLPYNRGGERIRVGVVTFAGDERVAGAAFEPSPAALLELARVDAAERIPLTGDYARLDRELARLASHAPRGSTDFAAGVGRSLATLGVLEAGVAAAPAPRRAERAILFLTDGKPLLPADRKSAERAALYASRLAGEAGVRIHTFALGHDIVRRGPNPVMRRMAFESGGRFTQLATPGEIVELLRSSSFSFVSEVRIANATRGEAAPEIATAIDGSFYAELPLAEGANEIEVEAVLNDGSRTTRRLTVTWVDTKPIKALEARLAEIRRENEALAVQVRERLAHEIRAERKRQARELTISVVK